MRTPIKIIVTACFLAAIAYSLVPARVGGKVTTPEAKPEAKTATKAKAAKRVPAHHLAPAKTPEMGLPAGFQSPCAGAREHQLPLPSGVPPAQFVGFEQTVLAFLQRGEYKQLGWCQDKSVRDTGPYKDGVYYGTHPAVRIFYSPKAMQWLINGRRGDIPDGAMIIKEQYTPPAARYDGLSNEQLPPVSDWTVMIKDEKGAKDGWFWGEFFTGMKFDDDSSPFDYPWAGYGLYCLRCHSTAESELTFSSLNNIAGFPGQPISYADDGSWRFLPQDDTKHGAQPLTPLQPGRRANPDFLQTFNTISGGVPFATVQKLPSETLDHVAQAAMGPAQFISSSQCMSCHGALNGPFGPVMFLPSAGATPGTPVGMNVSPYTEWRWSPMGLAGRDPIFFAQVESELEFIKTLPGDLPTKLTAQLQNVCLSCHGVMGKRQHDLDTNNADFKLDFLKITDRNDPNFKYGALARDGISCLSCHRSVPDQTPPGVTSLEHFLATSINGQFKTGPSNEAYGPFQESEIAPYAMITGVGIKPKYNAYLTSSRMCGSCHTIDLPVADASEGGTIALHSIEQSTYLEWLNSQYQTEFGTPGPQAKSCQQCHMSGSYHNEKKGINVAQINEKIAIIQDETYPESDNQIADDQINIRKRDDFRRHEFLGLNVFLLEMFNQFWDVLGVRKDDYMSGSKTGLQDTIDNFAQQAQERTAKLAVNIIGASTNRIDADVSVANLAGHRFPSGVGFRRAFIELLVKDQTGKVVWASGRTNNLGIIVDSAGKALPSEFHDDYTDAGGVKRQAYQPHHQVIDAQDEVQIYEELIQGKDGRFTTSFIRRDETFKDNRLLPIGWTEAGPDPSLNGRFLKATHPDGVEGDADYEDGGAGTDRVTYRITLPAGVDARGCTVEATLYHQSIPPSYLKDRFTGAPNGEATRRLYYLTSNLNLTGTVMEDWKLKIAGTAAYIPGQPAPGQCATICLRSPQFYLNRVATLPALALTISGIPNRVETTNTARMRDLLNGGSSVQDRFNQQYVTTQLSLYFAPGTDAEALASPLSCYGLSFAPLRFARANVVRVLSPNSTLRELLTIGNEAAFFGKTAELAALAEIFDLLNSNDPLGRCN